MIKKNSRAWPFLVVAVILLIWEAAVRIWDVPVYVLPAPSAVFATFAAEFSTLCYHGGVSFIEALTGMVISLVVAFFIAIAMDALPAFKNSVYPILVVTQTVPVIVLAPIFIIYMGFGYAPKILTVVLMCFFPIVVSFCDGMAQVDPGYVDLMRTYGAGKGQIYRLVKIPFAMPSLISGLKVAATYSISGAVVGEWIAAQSGLGYYLLRAKNAYMLDKVFASVLMIVLLSLVMNGLVRILDRLFTGGRAAKRFS